MSSLRQDLEAEDATKQATALLQVVPHLVLVTALQSGLAKCINITLFESSYLLRQCNEA